MVTANKRGKGEGSLYQRQSDGMWCGSLDLPPIDGKRRRKVVVGKTERAVKEKLKLIKRELLTHGDLPTAGQTLASWMDVYYSTIAVHRIRPRSATSYRSAIDQYIKPSIGTVRLDKLTPAHVRQMHDYITRQGLSSTTAMNTHRILKVALKYALREGRVNTNVATLTDAPRKARANLAVLSPTDAVTVLQTVKDDRLASRWAAALLTGARQGELLGLELDRVTDVLDLSWQLQRLQMVDGKLKAPPDFEYRHLTGGLYLTRPKSQAGWRIIPLVEPLRTILEHRIQVAATEPNPHGLVWTADQKHQKGGRRELLPLDGSPIDPSRDNKAWHVILDRAGVPQVRLHAARHTTASLLLQARVPAPVIIRILGHSSYATSVAYMDIDRDQLDAAMLAISAQFN